MAKPLSEQLADLSVRAKRAEDAFSAAQKEAHDKIEVRKQKARADATTAVEKVDQKIKSANDDAVRDWNSVKAKVAADIAALKTNVAEAKHNVAIPVSQFQLNGDKLVLPGATRDALKAAPEFDYAK